MYKTCWFYSLPSLAVGLKSECGVLAKRVKADFLTAPANEGWKSRKPDDIIITILGELCISFAQVQLYGKPIKFKAGISREESLLDHVSLGLDVAPPDESRLPRMIWDVPLPRGTHPRDPYLIRERDKHVSSERATFHLILGRHVPSEKNSSARAISNPFIRGRHRFNNYWLAIICTFAKVIHSSLNCNIHMIRLPALSFLIRESVRKSSLTSKRDSKVLVHFLKQFFLK